MVVLRRVIPVAALGSLAALALAAPANGTIAAAPNPCEVPAGAHACTVFVKWSTRGARQARVLVRAAFPGGAAEREFGAGTACSRCPASWIEAGNRYVFSLVDYSAGSRGAELASITVTAVQAPGAPPSSASGVLSAVPNPCRIPAGSPSCETRLSWSARGVDRAGVFVRAGGLHPAGEQPFGNGLSCDKCQAASIAAGTRYLFTLYDLSSGSRGRALASVVVTVIHR